MIKAEEYRARATDCDGRAERAGDVTVGDELREMARLWRHMAMQAEQRERERRL
jgi:hypothetical protein